MVMMLHARVWNLDSLNHGVQVNEWRLIERNALHVNVLLSKVMWNATELKCSIVRVIMVYMDILVDMDIHCDTASPTNLPAYVNLDCGLLAYECDSWQQ